MTKKNFSLLETLTGKENPTPTPQHIEQGGAAISQQPDPPTGKEKRKWEHRGGAMKTAGLKDGEIRVSLIVSAADWEKVQALAFHERAKIKDVTGAALAKFLKEWEAKHGQIKSIPAGGKNLLDKF